MAYLLEGPEGVGAGQSGEQGLELGVGSAQPPGQGLEVGEGPAPDLGEQNVEVVVGHRA